jgi:hypothetical protein
MAYGAETEDDVTQLDAEMNGWTKAEWCVLCAMTSRVQQLA